MENNAANFLDILCDIRRRKFHQRQHISALRKGQNLIAKSIHAGRIARIKKRYMGSRDEEGESSGEFIGTPYA